MAKTHPFRFAVTIARAESGSAWRERARRLEDLGYSTMFIPDTLGGTLSPLPALSVAAGSTSRLRVGGYVLVNDFRHPLQLAREAATLDMLSDGRVELGMGAGRPGVEPELEQLGLAVDSVGVRGDRLGEAVDIIKRLFAGEKVTTEGGFYRLTEAELYPRPVQAQGPPVLIAAGGRRALRRAGRQADIIAIAARPDATEEFLTERIGWVREGAGARFDEIELNTGLLFLPEGADLQVARRVARVDLDQVLASPQSHPTLITGSPDGMVEQVEALRERFGLSYFNVGDHAADVVAPLVARLAGS
ncbi:MAG TPA: TIGR03621 family F420-dependent LLM class oxidoreductase [Candidatus Dormibacteraeota bacterium]|jgi:probable F420-dependent oxidoreductase|nr:TIGR03621 family F420-dependent LLM class oxidoreductase [Candidatus Dormibacteraeota bacterium]